MWEKMESMYRVWQINFRMRWTYKVLRDRAILRLTIVGLVWFFAFFLGCFCNMAGWISF